MKGKELAGEFLKLDIGRHEAGGFFIDAVGFEKGEQSLGVAGLEAAGAFKGGQAVVAAVDAHGGGGGFGFGGVGEIGFAGAEDAGVGAGPEVAVGAARLRITAFPVATD